MQRRHLIDKPKSVALMGEFSSLFRNRKLSGLMSRYMMPLAWHCEMNLMIERMIWEILRSV